MKLWKEGILLNSNVMYTPLSVDTKENQEKTYLRQLQSKFDFKFRQPNLQSNLQLHSKFNERLEIVMHRLRKPG